MEAPAVNDPPTSQAGTIFGIEVLICDSITKEDITTLKTAGFHTVDSIMFVPKKHLL